MPSTGLSLISQPGASSNKVARQWLVKFAEICQKEITPALAGIWAEQLGDIPADLLDRACDRLAKTWTSGFLPTPGDVRAQIKNADAGGLEVEAAEAWDRWLAHVREYFLSDLGWDRRAPRLDAMTEHAGNAAGGAHWVERCPEEDLHWCRERFLEDYTATRKTGEVQDLLTRREAKKIFASLCSETHAKQLARPPAVEEPSKPDEATLQAFDEVSQAINAPVPPSAGAILTDTEWEARKARQLRAISEAFPGWREDHRQKIHLYIQLRTEGFPERRIAQQLFPGWPRRGQLLRLEDFTYIFGAEIEACAGAALLSSASVGEETRCAG